MPRRFARTAYRYSPRSVRRRRDLAGYVVRITLLVLAVALAVDVAAQLAFFLDWTTALRSWLLTTAVVLAIAVPIARAVGLAYLEVFTTRAEYEKLSRTDPLTGLDNRRAMLATAEAPAAQQQALVLAIADIDRFKLVNDTHGHRAGDRIIQLVGTLMGDAMARHGRVARLGGEEFAVVAAGNAPQAIVSDLVALVDRLASAPMLLEDGTPVSVTISAGVALRPPGGSFDALYAAADKALYQAKAAGRNRVVLAPELVASGVLPSAMPVRVAPTERRSAPRDVMPKKNVK